MVPDKLVLLEQITTVIKKNSCKGESGNEAGQRIQESSRDVQQKNMLANLEQRVEMLENQNDRLLYFIHFLYKNFPELVKDILPIPPPVPAEGSIEMTTVTGSCNNPCPLLTPRENEVLHLVLKGLGAKEIASQLFISESTVITHKKNLKEKYKAKNTAELISKAFHIAPED